MTKHTLPEPLLANAASFDDHEQVVRFELEGGFIAFIAVHNTNLGPALGGCRMRPYADEADALDDVLRLSRGMTYKNAMAGLPLGGGKAVIIADPFKDKTDELMQEMGRAVESLEGAYITAEDSGTTEEDMVQMATETEFVVGLPPEMLAGNKYGELGGNPSPLTALGCYHGIKAAMQFKYKDVKALKDMTVSVQGVGAVGLELAKLLDQDGASLIICDVNEDNLQAARMALKNLKDVVEPDDIYGVEADIFAPCAMGGVLNDETIEMLNVDIIAGASNNQLLSDYHDQQLQSKGITYVPDYVINSGGVICVGYEFFRNSGYNPQDFDIARGSMVAHVERIAKTVLEILEEAEAQNKGTGETADALAEKRFLEGVSLNDEDDTTALENASHESARVSKVVQ